MAACEGNPSVASNATDAINDARTLVSEKKRVAEENQKADEALKYYKKKLGSGVSADYPVPSKLKHGGPPFVQGLFGAFTGITKSDYLPILGPVKENGEYVLRPYYDYVLIDPDGDIWRWEKTKYHPEYTYYDY